MTIVVQLRISQGGILKEIACSSIGPTQNPDGLECSSHEFSITSALLQATFAHLRRSYSKPTNAYGRETKMKKKVEKTLGELLKDGIVRREACWLRKMGVDEVVITLLHKNNVWSHNLRAWEKAGKLVRNLTALPGFGPRRVDHLIYQLDTSIEV